MMGLKVSPYRHARIVEMQVVMKTYVPNCHQYIAQALTVRDRQRFQIGGDFQRQHAYGMFPITSDWLMSVNELH